MTCPEVFDLLDEGSWNVLTVAADTFVEVVDPSFDAQRALADPEAVRDLLRFIAQQGALRRLVRGRLDNPHPLVAADAAEAERACNEALAQIKHRTSEARRTKRAEKRGTADERRLNRLLADLSKARQDRAAAIERADEAARLIDSMRTSLAELDDAVGAETRRADAVAAAHDAARRDLADPAALAANLAGALEDNPAPLLAAADVLEGAVRTQSLAWFGPLLRELANPSLGRAKQAKRALTVDMLGGGIEVGGSCALVTADDTRILIDVGTRPNASSTSASAPPRLDEAFAGDIHAIVITHAHADHAGWIPALLAQRPGIPVYTTTATADLLPTMWSDAARIYQREDRTPGPAPFTEQDVRAALAQVHPVEFNRPLHVRDLSISLFPAGHIVGAAGVLVSDGQHTAVISGDVSGPGQRTVGGYELPAEAHGADLLVLEATYGNAANLAPRERVVAEFIKDISVVVAGGGRVLVPAFALGRAQEIALLCAEHLPHVPVRIDGLARDITRAYQKHNGADGRPMTILSDKVQVVPRGRTSETAETFTNGIIITTSGMLTGGPAATWARHILPDPNSALMIVGYQDPDSPGGKLERFAETGEKFTLPVFGGEPQSVEVNARVRTYGLGAHASSDELIALATTVRAKTTMLVHGDPPARRVLAERLASRHIATLDASQTWRAERVDA